MHHFFINSGLSGYNINMQKIVNSQCNQIELKLRQNPLFSRLDNDQLDSLCRHSRMIELKEGGILFNHGDPVHYFYFVHEGLIKLYRESPNGQEKIFELERTGHLFAEALMFQELTTYPVSASAMKDSTIIAINTRHFLSSLKKSADTGLLIMAALSRRIHELINEVDKLSTLSGRNRVATYFLDQSMTRGLEFKLEIPKNAIASMLSLQPETFSRLIKELCNQNAIHVKDNLITVIDLNKLRESAGIV